jgi:protein-tyrosine phosphatase
MDIQAHRARTVSLELLEEFDLILTMEPGHKEAISIEFPSVAGRVFLLSEMVGLNAAVEDPYGSQLEKYQEAAETIAYYLREGMPRILELVERRQSQEGA